MRTALAILMLTFALRLTAQPMHGQTRAANTLVIEEIYMIDQKTGWAVTRDQNRNPAESPMGLARTTDGGNNWRDVTPTITIAGRTIRYAGPKVFVFTGNFAWIGGVRTVDGGQTWRQSKALMTGSLVWIDFVDANDGWALTLDPAGGSMANPATVVLWSTDAGETWNKAAEHSSLHWSVGSLTFVSRATGWATLGGPNVGRDWFPLVITRNAGRTWAVQSVPRPPGVPSAEYSWVSDIWPLKFFTPRDGIFPASYAYVDPLSKTRVSFAIPYVTHDGGTTWTYATPVSVANQCLACIRPQAPIVMMNFADINHGWIADGDTLYATINSGRQWTTIRPASFPGAKQLNFISPQVGWAVTGGTLLKTLDGGRTWSPVDYTISRQ
jgi:photosystem II stability/assembly factor-like uncharacterized protein